MKIPFCSFLLHHHISPGLEEIKLANRRITVKSGDAALCEEYEPG
jgi:hypothetical protein